MNTPSPTPSRAQAAFAEIRRQMATWSPERRAAWATFTEVFWKSITRRH